MEQLYSTIFVVDISQNPDEVDTVASRIQQLVEDHGGILKEIKRVGKRRLAYLIDKKSHGFYVEIEFTANSHLNIPRILEDEYRLNDRVLRYMTYIVTPKEIVQRAKKAKATGSEKEKPAVPAETVKAAPVKTPVDELAETPEIVAAENNEPEVVEEAPAAEEAAPASESADENSVPESEAEEEKE